MDGDGCDNGYGPSRCVTCLLSWSDPRAADKSIAGDGNGLSMFAIHFALKLCVAVQPRRATEQSKFLQCSPLMIRKLTAMGVQAGLVL